VSYKRMDAIIMLNIILGEDCRFITILSSIYKNVNKNNYFNSLLRFPFVIKIIQVSQSFDTRFVGGGKANA